MDMFFECSAAVPGLKRRRVHFHDMMAEVHRRAFDWRADWLRTRQRSKGVDLRPQHDAMVQVAKLIAADADVLCFDELDVSDVADAMVLHRVFSTIFQLGSLCIFTSNKHPASLYEGGLNRSYFLRFVDELTAHCRIVELNSAADYRREAAALCPQPPPNATPRFLLAAPSSSAAVSALAPELLHDDARPAVLSVAGGRELRVPLARGSSCWFTFQQLCGGHTYSCDFAAVVGRYETLALTGVPKFTRPMHNELKRFVVLVDQAYEAGTRLLCSAECEIDGLFAEFTAIDEEVRAARRAAESQLFRPSQSTDVSAVFRPSARSLPCSTVRAVSCPEK